MITNDSAENSSWYLIRYPSNPLDKHLMDSIPICTQRCSSMKNKKKKQLGMNRFDMK